MGKYTDCSAAIAWLSVVRSLLNELDPVGNWREIPLYQQWEQNRYALDLEDLEDLGEMLWQECRKLTYLRVKGETLNV